MIIDDREIKEETNDGNIVLKVFCDVVDRKVVFHESPINIIDFFDFTH